MLRLLIIPASAGLHSLAATAALLTLAPAAPVPDGDGKPQLYFAITKGTKWVYDEDGREWTEVITEVKTKGKDIVVAVGRVGADGKITPYQRVAVSAKGLVLLERDGDELKTPVRLLEPPFPPLPDIPELEGLKDVPLLGPTWAAGDMWYSVGGPEPVRVPAGKYMAARATPWGLSAGGASAEGGSLVLPLTETLWYAPGVGLVKRTLTSEGGRNTLSERVLKKFTPGKP